MFILDVILLAIEWLESILLAIERSTRILLVNSNLEIAKGRTHIFTIVEILLCTRSVYHVGTLYGYY